VGSLLFLATPQLAVGYRDSGGSLLDHQATTIDESSLLIYLGQENARLQQLVAELLIKNEQLRQIYLASSAVTDG
jgi:hypothetical protein